jgi:hypothetical protein
MADGVTIATFGVAVATLVLALVTVFGNELRGKWLPPDLKPEILDPEGEFIIQVSSRGETIPARYYHLRVSNRRSFVADEVQVKFIRIESDNVPQPYTVAMPLQWQNQGLDERPWRSGRKDATRSRPAIRAPRWPFPDADD